MIDNSTSVVSLSEFTSVVQRWLRLIIGAVLVGGLTGTLLLAVQPQRYVSQALVGVRPIVSREDDPNLDFNRQIDVDTEVVIARSQRVAEQALTLRSAAILLDTDDFGSAEVMSGAEMVELTEVDRKKARDALAELEVSVVGESTILSFRATSASPERARDLAQSTAVAYLEFRRVGAQVGAADSRQRLEQREAELLSELEALGDDVVLVVAGDGTPPGGDEAAGGDVDARPTSVLAFETVAKRQELVAIGSKFANLQALSIDPGVLLNDAALPTGPEGLPLAAGPVTGGLLGLIGALTAALILDRNDDRLRSSRIELGAIGVPLLGNAPIDTRRSGKTGGARIHPVNSPAGDAYRRLQGSLLFTLDNMSKSVLLLAGVNNPTAATTVAANLGAIAARSGRKTLLLGADLRSDQLGDQFGLPPAKGLSDVVLDGFSLMDAIRSVPDYDNLWLLGAGTRLDHPADVLQSEATARLVAAVGVDFDLVIVEAAPVLQVADAVDMAPLCHGSVVVVDARNETRGAIADSVRQLRGVGSDVIGVVVAETP